MDFYIIHGLILYKSDDYIHDSQNKAKYFNVL